MDKQSFLNLAPEYYMLALYIHLQYPAEYYTDVNWVKDFSYHDHDAGDEYCYVGNAALRAEAIRLMRRYNAITTVAPNHGWRHRFKTEGRRAGMVWLILDAIQGHAPRTEGESYGEVPPDVMLLEILKYPKYHVEVAGRQDRRRRGQRKVDASAAA